MKWIRNQLVRQCQLRVRDVGNLSRPGWSELANNTVFSSVYGITSPAAAACWGVASCYVPCWGAQRLPAISVTNRRGGEIQTTLDSPGRDLSGEVEKI